MHEETSKEQIASWDKQYLWHPFTQMKDFAKEEPLIIVDGKGVMLRDINGEEYIDGVSSKIVSFDSLLKTYPLMFQNCNRPEDLS